MKIVELNQFQCKSFYQIKHVKFYRTKNISPDRLRILSDTYHFYQKIHEKSENEQFQ